MRRVTLSDGGGSGYGSSQLNDNRVAYITPYQGPSLVKQRPVVRNRSVSNKIKIELIAKALHATRWCLAQDAMETSGKRTSRTAQ